ncbi:hypothetical protein AB0420_08085 [Streptomyces caelestis]|uniref:Uncharacterized protein n=1 Tax=Streptomyces heliomycini TaxID=284032 RepID=A0ABV5LLN9_9ACTN
MVRWVVDMGTAVRPREPEPLSRRLVPRREPAESLHGSPGRRVSAAPDALADGSGAAEPEDGYRVRRAGAGRYPLAGPAPRGLPSAA